MIINGIIEYICGPQIASLSLPVSAHACCWPQCVKQVSPPMPMSESHLFAWPWPLLPHQVFLPLASKPWLVFPQSLHTTRENQLPTTVLIFIHKQCFSPL